MSVTFHLVRHGETDWNLERRLQGHTDIPLNATGVAQAQAVARHLAELSIGAVYSSDLARARDTAAAIAAHHELPLSIDHALRERTYGTAEGRLDSDLRSEYGDRLDEYWARADLAFPGGETRLQVYERVCGVLDALIADPPAAEIVVVSHGGTIRVALDHLQAGALQHGRRDAGYSIENGSVHSVTVAATGTDGRARPRRPVSDVSG